jgi:putative transcriptional regulator
MTAPIPGTTKYDWRAADALTDAQIRAAALADPDAQPLSGAQLQRPAKRPNPKVVRHSLGLSQEAFAERFKIPVGTPRDWERGRVEPDEAARLPYGDRAHSAVSQALEEWRERIPGSPDRSR